MTATALIQYMTWTIFVMSFLLACVHLVRQPRRANFNIALLFGLCTFIIAVQFLARLNVYRLTPLLADINGMLFLLLPFVLLRLVDDFAGVAPLLMRASVIAYVVAVVGLFVFEAMPLWLTIWQVTYFIGLQVYIAIAFSRAAQHSSGVTQRRLTVIALGSVFLASAVFAIVLQPLHMLWGVLFQVLALGSSVCYFLGFTPPRFLRRAWQEPELRAFLGLAAQLPHLPTTKAVIRNLERGARTSLGASNAVIGIWESASNLLHFEIDGEVLELAAIPGYTSGKAFVEQRSLFVENAFQEMSDYTDITRRYNARVILSTPITAGDNRLGVLSVFTAQMPIFAEDDLELVHLLADQAAVILESRTLIDEASRVQAREEVTRLKDDFLSAAAHDLKTPLTTIVGRAQLLERRALREPEKPADLRSIQSIVVEAQRLQGLVRELLDASRAEHGQLLGVLNQVDLVEIAREACEQLQLPRHQIVIDAPISVVGMFDRVRMRQLIDNLYENAVKYSPEGGLIDVKMWQEEHDVHLSVADQGIGIPPNDLPYIFERFYRAKNVDDKMFAGMGLGLFICQSIVEQHGGRMWVTPHTPIGTIFRVQLPLGGSSTIQDDK